MRGCLLMKQLAVTAIVSFLLAVSGIACTDQKEKGRGLSLFRRDERIREGEVERKGDKSKDSLASGIDRPVTAEELTLELFVKITIMYNKQNRRWIEESQSLPPKKQEQYLESMNNEFFSVLGLTEEEYVAYSQAHIEELDAYIEKHPELRSQLMEQ